MIQYCQRQNKVQGARAPCFREDIMIHFTTFLTVCPLVFAAGFVDAAAGGGGLISLPAYMIAGLPVHSAIGTNKLSSAMGTLLATIRFARDGYINWKRSAVCILCALGGAAIGSSLALRIEERIFTIAMLFIIPVSAAFILKSHAISDQKEEYSFRKTLLISMAVAFIIGIYDGIYGPGTGTFLILALSGLAHMKLSDANGTTKTINLTTNLTALAIFLMHGKVQVVLGLVAGAFSIAGNLLGARFFEKGGSRVTKPLMIVVLLIFFIKEISTII